MYESDSLEVWNLTADGTAYIGAQRIFNVIGRVKNASHLTELTYSLNGRARRPVILGGSPRNIGVSHFNIDTLNIEDLAKKNDLELWVRNGEQVFHNHIPFVTRTSSVNEPRFDLIFDGIHHPEEVGQCIDGRWQISVDGVGRPCLEIRPEHAGYDRLFGIGRFDWTGGYRVEMDFRVTKWTRHDYFNVGLLFKWNPHSQGDGTTLPIKWSTGLAYYASNCPGLRLRYGINVHFDSVGRKHGEYLLQEKPISAWKYWARNNFGKFGRIVNRPLAQINPGILYTLDLLIHPNIYILDIFKENKCKPLASLRVPDPPDLLPTGCVGLIACNCAARFYRLRVSPAHLDGSEKMLETLNIGDSRPI